MKENSDTAIENILKVEKWQSFERNALVAIWGIDERYWPNEFKLMLPMSELESKEYAVDFYYSRYWIRFGCDNLSSPLDIIHCDTAVNSESMANWLIGHSANWQDYLFKRIMLYSEKVKNNPDKIQYFRGWVNRCINLYLSVSKQIKGV